MDNKAIGNRIKQEREAKSLTLQDIADEIGVAKSTIQRYEAGRIENIKLPVLSAIANVLNVNPDYLIGKSKTKHAGSHSFALPEGATPYAATHRIPILGAISAGLPLYAEQHIEGYTYTDLNHGHEYFALRVKGDSMNAARIYEGDILIVRRQSNAENGDIVVVLVKGFDATVKKIFFAAQNITLAPMSTNPGHEPQIYTNADELNILGKVVRSQINYE